MRRLVPALMLVLVACSSGGEEPPARGQAVSVPECTDAAAAPIEGRNHVESGAIVRYATEPPTSGDHFGRWVDAATIYEVAVPDGNQVHNLEHGHVIIQHRGLTDAQLQVVRDAFLADPFMVIMAPRPDMPFALALTAWGAIQTCEAFPPRASEVIEGFISAHRDAAPESIP